MAAPRSERDDGIVATVAEWWSAYQLGELDVHLLSARLGVLDQSLEGDVDDPIRRAVPRLESEVELLSFTEGLEALDRRLAEAMNRFLIEIGEAPVAVLDRTALVELVTQCREGLISLETLRAEARRTWLAGLAPTDDVVARDALFMLVLPDSGELNEADMAALLDYLNTPPGSDDAGRERLGDYFLGRWPDEQLQVDEQAHAELDELVLALPSQRRLSRLIRESPEAAWPEVADRLCSPATDDEMFLVSSLEDLLYRHPDAFIDRIERLAMECPPARERICQTHIGGIAPTPALQRFWALQQKLDFERVVALHRLAEVERSAGRLDEAEQLLRQALSVRGPDGNGTSGEEETELAEVLLERGGKARIAEAKALLDRRSEDMSLSVRSRFKLCVAQVRVSIVLGEQGLAQQWAVAALEVSAQKDWGLSHHPKLGLVESDAGTIDWLEAVASARGDE